MNMKTTLFHRGVPILHYKFWKLSYKSGNCPSSLETVLQIWELSYKSGSCPTNLGTVLQVRELYYKSGIKADSDRVNALLLVTTNQG